MGVLNVTPDSFSDGGRWSTVKSAIAHAEEMVARGADIIDVGGESTRPGASRVALDEEQSRVMPVIRELAERGIPVSIDTMNAQTAHLAVIEGATIVNDVSGGLADPAMAETVAHLGVTMVVSHWRGHSATMQSRAVYTDVVDDVVTELSERVSELASAGIPAERIILDPGLGFAKTSEHNWKILGHLHRLQELGYPVMIGASRKRFVADLLKADARESDRDFSSAILAAIATVNGAWAVRVHDVHHTRAALDVADAWRWGARS